MEMLHYIWNFLNVAPDCTLCIPPLIGALIGMAGGAAKHFAVDKPQADRDRHVAAETQRYSPWTKMQAQPVQNPNLFGSALQFGTTGAALGQGIQGMESNTDLNNALVKNINAKTAGLSSSGIPIVGANPPWNGMLNNPTYGTFDYDKYKLMGQS